VRETFVGKLFDWRRNVDWWKRQTLGQNRNLDLLMHKKTISCQHSRISGSKWPRSEGTSLITDKSRSRWVSFVNEITRQNFVVWKCKSLGWQSHDCSSMMGLLPRKSCNHQVNWTASWRQSFWQHQHALNDWGSVSWTTKFPGNLKYQSHFDMM
jgi:hypothetical protein